MDPRARISRRFLEAAPSNEQNLEPRILDGHYQKSLMVLLKIQQNDISNIDFDFLEDALRNYAEMLVQQNFWEIAHLAKKKRICEIDPFLVDEVYRICQNIDDLKAILYFDSQCFDK